VADADCLARSSGSGRCGGGLNISHTDATGKPTTDLLGSIQFSPGECTRPGDQRPRAIIIWSLSLKQPQNPICTVGSPCGDKTSIGFA
jgi:hypothetical protein